MTFLARTSDSGGSLDRPLVRSTGASGARGAAQRAAAAALTPSRLSLGRAGVGATMMLRPTLLGDVMGSDRTTSTGAAWVVQMLGARELALGAGAVTALRRGDSRAARLWLAAGMLCDAVDAVVVAGAVGRGRVATAPGAALVAVATAAAAVQAGALTQR